ncbi:MULTISPECIES: HAD family hydrolase [unclassified Leifsonia]|uniref:HAD family hydrolase n=1 Tax=unclassified Leifsonia TaxID=2663824 RepID=UPI0006FC031B|nr:MULTISPECIES: HAD family hydrolase [unclassified Leifsonia]KQX06346.1 hydrolase [Leifsonia sp. Root1293]KRA10630.1 hydrolase [Leifsonia sp. Root60]
MSGIPAAVLFDLDDTLFAHRGAVARAIEVQMDAVGFSSPDRAGDVALWHDLEERHYHSYLAGTLDFQGQRRARARDFAAAHGVVLAEAAAGAWFDDYFEHYRAAWVLHDDALDALAALRRARDGIRIGVITNGEPAFQQAKLDTVGLTTLVDGIVASGSLGITKPDPRIFEFACSRLGVAPGEAAYVGDRLRTDAIGAASAGMTGVWLNRTGLVPEATDAADARQRGVLEITGLDQLVGALEG